MKNEPVSESKLLEYIGSRDPNICMSVDVRDDSRPDIRTVFVKAAISLGLVAREWRVSTWETGDDVSSHFQRLCEEPCLLVVDELERASFSIRNRVIHFLTNREINSVSSRTQIWVLQRTANHPKVFVAHPPLRW